MSFTPRANWFIDIDRWGGQKCMLAGRASTLGNDRITVKEGDIFDLGLYFRRQTTAGQTSTAIDVSTNGIVVAGKVDDTLVIFNDVFTSEGSGDDAAMVGELSLNTDELIAAMEASTGGYIDLDLDLELQFDSNAKRITYSIPLRVHRQHFQGDEVDPTPATPVYPSPGTIITTAQLVLPAGMRLVIDDNGNPRLESIT
jgi:hypothetical protein